MQTNAPPLPPGFKRVPPQNAKPPLPPGFKRVTPEEVKPAPFKEEVLRKMTQDAPEPIRTVNRVGLGMGKGFYEMASGIAQLGARLMGEDAAADKIYRAQEGARRTEKNVGGMGVAGKTGEIVGPMLIPAAGMKAVTRFGPAVNAALTTVKRAGAGAFYGATANATETADQQKSNAAVGALVAPLVTFAGEKALGAAGSKLTSTYQRLFGEGMGKKMFDRAGNLTPYGQAFRIRLKSVNRDVPDDVIDAAMQEIKKFNPKLLPVDEAVVPEMLARREGVNLTRGMKTRDAQEIMDFEAAQTGTYGKSGQKRSVDMAQDIDNSIRDNIRSLGTGADSETTAREVGRGLLSRDKAAQRAKNDIYDDLRFSKEPIERAPLKTVAENAFRVRGQGGTDTLTPQAKSFYMELYNTGNKKGSVRFGQLWDFSRRLNAEWRSAKGAAKVELGDLQKQLNEHFDELAKAGNNSIAGLKEANAANREYMRLFGANDKTTKSGRNFPDRSGRAVEDIIELAKQPDVNSAKIESAIFGGAKQLDTEGAKQAATTMRRILKAAPNLQPQMRDLTLNRIITRIESGFGEKALNQGQVQKTIGDLVDRNADLLRASGFTPAEITKLKVNTYLAALKSAPQGAKNPSKSGYLLRGLVTSGFRRVLSASMGVGTAAATGGVGGLVAGGAAALATEGAEQATRSAIVRRATSVKVPPRPNVAGTRAGKTIARAAGAQSAREAAKGDE